MTRSRHNPRGNGSAAAMGIVLVGIALALGWLVVAPILLAPVSQDLDGPLAGTEGSQTASPALMPGVRILANAQTAQPRDPFRPLITEDGTVIGPGGSNGNGGEVPPGFQVTLKEIRVVDGVPRATVEVGGVEYDVGEGDTFAEDFMVVSLTDECGVFLYRDNAFELCEGQSILK